MKRTSIILAAVFCAAATTSAWAEDADKSRSWGDWDLTIGAGVAGAPEYDGASDFTIEPLPVFDLLWRDDIFLSYEDGLGWNAYQTRNLRLGPVADFYWGSDNRPTGIGDVDPGFQVGAFAEFAFDHYKFDTTLLQAVSGSSEGLRVDVGAAVGTRIDKDWSVILRANTMFFSGNEMKTYFGINSSEASDSGLAEHSPGAGFKDAGLDATIKYDIDENWSVRGIGKFHYLLGDAADSPLVGEEFQVYGGLAVAYHF